MRSSKRLLYTAAEGPLVGRRVATIRVAAFAGIAVAACTLIGAAAVLTLGEDEAVLADAGRPAAEKPLAPPADAEPARDAAAADDAVPAADSAAAADMADTARATAETEPPIETARADVAVSRAEPAAPTPATERFAGIGGVQSSPFEEADMPAPDGKPVAPAAADAPAEALALVEPEPARAAEPASDPVAAPDADQPVEVAETEAEALAIEERLSSQGAAYFQLPPEPDDPFEAAIAEEVPLPAAFTTQWVNMRAGPDNDAQVLTVVPGNAEIGAQADCESWCEVVYDGQRGYIYQSFIRRAQ